VLAIARPELGGDPVVDIGRLAQAVAEPMRVADGREAYPSIVPKAAALMLTILWLRPFSSSNARIALLAGTVFLNRNGLDLQGENDELTALVAVAATGELTVLQTAAALERFVVRLTPGFAG
jgi:death-on-curing protein